MAYFKRDKPRFGSDRPQLHQAICANCGKSCEVPFKPNGSKPVLCRDCFKNNDGTDARGFENRGDRKLYDAVCSNCGNNCKIPFRPTAGREVLCSNCFEKNGPIDTRKPFEKQNSTAPDYRPQFEALHAKMDKILDILNAAMSEAPPVESAIDENVIEEIFEEIEKKETVAKKPKKTTKKSPTPKKK